MNVYIPLVDLTENNGALQVLPGSHIHRIHPTSPTRTAPVMPTMPVLLTVPVGSVVIYDFRLQHRGTRNKGHTGREEGEGGKKTMRNKGKTVNAGNRGNQVNQGNQEGHNGGRANDSGPHFETDTEIDQTGARPVLYLTFARPWFTDRGQFTNESIWDKQ